MTVSYDRSLPPHIFSNISVPKKVWGASAALLPWIFVRIISDPWNVVRILAVSFFAGAVAEYAGHHLFRKRSEHSFYLGSFLHLALLLVQFLLLKIGGFLLAIINFCGLKVRDFLKKFTRAAENPNLSIHPTPRKTVIAKAFIHALKEHGFLLAIINKF